jgi:hypothetical protein
MAKASTTAMASQGPREKQVEQHLIWIDKHCEMLLAEIATMEQALMPILNQQPTPARDVIAVDKGPLCALAQALEEKDRRIERAVAMLRDLRERLEV